MTAPATRRFLRLGTLEHLGGHPVYELQDPESGERFTLWPGLPPPPPPSCSGLARPVLLARLEGEPRWLETRPEGVPLQRLRGRLAPAQLLLLLRDACEALERLHAEGRAHGQLRASRLLLTPGGRLVLVGLGLQAAEPWEDVAELLRAGRSLLRSGGEGMLELPPVAPPSAGDLRELLAGALEGADEERLRRELGELARSRLRRPPPGAPELELLVEGEGVRGSLDELQPDGLEAPSSQESSATTGDWARTLSTLSSLSSLSTLDAVSGTLEHTEATRTASGVESPPGQVLARILAPPGPAPPRERWRPPTERLRELLRAPPPDPLVLVPASLDLPAGPVEPSTLAAGPAPPPSPAPRRRPRLARPLLLAALLLAALLLAALLLARG